MTPRQKQTLDFIRNYMAESGGVSPTLIEIAAGLGVASKSAVVGLIESLVTQGRLARRKYYARSFVVTDVSAFEQGRAVAKDEAYQSGYRRGYADARIAFRSRRSLEAHQ